MSQKNEAFRALDKLAPDGRTKIVNPRAPDGAKNTLLMRLTMAEMLKEKTGLFPLFKCVFRM